MALCRRDVLKEPWRGVSLGGWLLLEPGPSRPLFNRYLGPDGEEVACEWDLMKLLRKTKGKKGALEVITRHRETHITKADFQRIRECGLNAVRLPFGYWAVVEPAAGEPYFGPALEYIDRAVQWAEECGLQIVLDLHGCPGGESAEVPCGRKQRPETKWHYSQWRMGESLNVLTLLAKRYKSRECVTGIAVCNEPSNTVPDQFLCRYYDRAVRRIRAAGMPGSRVAVVLPIFQRDEVEIIKRWEAMTKGQHENVCFDVHCYHCFENEFHGKSLAQQLRAIEENAEMLRKYPMVVGEWSLELGEATWCTCGAMEPDEVFRIFGRAQLEAFEEASHGHFFWNWTEDVEAKTWNFQVAWKEGLFSGPLYAFPPWTNKRVEDPLEELLDPSPLEPRILYGDPIYMRVFYGRYVDVQGPEVAARWSDRGTWQELSFLAPASGVRETSLVRREIKNGDVVRLKSRSNRFLMLGEDGSVVATRGGSNPSCEFKVHLERGKVMRHRSIVYLQSRTSGTMLDVDETEDGLFARYTDKGWWQSLIVEHAIQVVSPETPEKQVRSTRLQDLALSASPSQKGATRKEKPRLAQGSPLKLEKLAQLQTESPENCKRPWSPAKGPSTVELGLSSPDRSQSSGSRLDLCEPPAAKMARVR